MRITSSPTDLRNAAGTLPSLRTRAIARIAALLGGCALLTACHEPMIATPHVMYGDAGRAAFAQTPTAQRTPEMRVMYVTDRTPEPSKNGEPKYGYGRSPAMEYGVATCTFGADVTWDELVADSVGTQRAHEYRPKVVSVEKVGTMVPIVSRMQVVNGSLIPKPGTPEQIALEQDQLNKTIALWLDHTERKEAVVFIHGFNNSFDEAVLRLAQAWHFTGRQGVPIVFTWPAGSPGLLSGYQHDRESGEYANLHLKMLLVALARDPQIERIHIIAHSRGTDVAITAVRELHAEIRGGLGASFVCSSLGIPSPGGQPLGSAFKPPLSYIPLKLETLVLAAPDLDIEVFSQRYIGENVLLAAKKTVIYYSENDSALGISDWLFNSSSRVGNFKRSDMNQQAIALTESLTNLELINCRVTGGSTHSYVLQHPAALSDLILLLREKRAPGAENGRPLKEPFKGFWELDNDYMLPQNSEAAPKQSAPK